MFCSCLCRIGGLSAGGAVSAYDADDALPADGAVSVASGGRPVPSACAILQDLFVTVEIVEYVAEILPRTGHVDRESESLRSVDVLLSVVDEKRLFGAHAACGDHLAENRLRGLQLVQFVGEENGIEIVVHRLAVGREHPSDVFHRRGVVVREHAGPDSALAQGVYLAAQCCEHLNRAIVIEQEAAEKYGYEQVNAVPQPHAGGSWATNCWQAVEHPGLVEEVRAAAGIDIGGTLIGMHLKRVAVPVRLTIKQIGAAPIICARTRPKYIGGSRAVYQEM